jgi:hypothetical protein
VRLVTLPKGTFVKFKAHDSHFFVRYPDPKPMYARSCPHTRPCALAAHPNPIAWLVSKRCCATLLH